jgi:thymidine kinase
MVPKLKLFVGPMFSGKSTKLIHNIERYKLGNKKILTFKPRMDNRYTDDGFIVTHSDIHETCYLINSGEDLIKIFENEENVNAIAIDEAFMIEGIANAALEIFYNNKIDVLISSIDISASLVPFEEVAILLSHATHIKKCKAVCTACGADASYTLRKFSIDNKSDQIRVGGNDLYEPRCLKHHSGILES